MKQNINLMLMNNTASEISVQLKELYFKGHTKQCPEHFGLYTEMSSSGQH